MESCRKRMNGDYFCKKVNNMRKIFIFIIELRRDFRYNRANKGGRIMQQKVYNERILDKMVDLYIKKNIEYCKLSKKLNTLSVKAFESRKMSKEILRTNNILNQIICVLSNCLSYFELYHKRDEMEISA